MSAILWLCICAILILLIFVIVWANKIKTPSVAFSPVIVGPVKNVRTMAVVDFATNFSENTVRALAVISKDSFYTQKGQMGKAMEIYSLIDQKLFPEIYKTMHENSIAATGQLGAIILSHYTPNGLEVYTMSSFKEGAAMELTDNIGHDAELTVEKLYQRLKDQFSDYLVVVISGPNLTDVHEMGQTFLPIARDDEDFGMYEGSLESWLSHHPSKSSVKHYTDKKQMKSLSTVMSADIDGYMPYMQRFQTMQYSDLI